VKRIASKTLLAGVAAAVAMCALPTSPASADPGETVIGKCVASADADEVATNGQNQGIIAVYALMLTSAHDPDPNAEVDCKITVDGFDAPGTELVVHANAAGVVSGQQQISFNDAGGTLSSALCERDIWGDGDSTGWVCQPFTPLRSPAGQTLDQAVADVLNLVNSVPGLIDTVFATVICPTLQQLGLGSCH